MYADERHNELTEWSAERLWKELYFFLLFHFPFIIQFL